MVSLFAMGVRPPERLIKVDRIATLLRQPGGATMTRLVAALGERRDVISNDLETMRDDLGFAIRWNPATGTYCLDVTAGAVQRTREDCDLALLYRAIALEEYLYVSFTTAAGEINRLHALPGKVRKTKGKRRVKLTERSGAWRRVDLEDIREVAEAFGMNK